MSGLARIRLKIMKEKVSEYVMVAEAADILGVSQGTVRSWAAAGKIPMHKNPANGYRLFRRTDLETFLKRIAKRVSISTISR
jgi:excisionase family DNA binding protein